MIYKLSVNDIKNVCWHPFLGAPDLTEDEKNTPFIEVRIKTTENNKVSHL